MNSTAAKFSIWLLLCSVAGCQGGLPVKKVVSGTVTKVHDGDSLHITPAGKKRVVVRLAAIDAPEIKQDHGLQSRDYLRSMVMDRNVTAHCNKIDKYRRQICVVSHKDRDINLAMLSAGYAWYYTAFKDEQAKKQQRAYRKAEAKAQRDRMGLWQYNPVAPWIFRSQAQ